MIVACPQCEAKYRVDPARVGPDGARLRCAKCQSVFRVEAPAAAAEAAPVAAPPAAAPVAAAPPAQVSVPAAPPAVDPQPAPVEATPDRERMVLIADSDPESAKAAADAVTSWGLSPVVVLDGVEAMLSIQRLLPRVVVLDAGLTKMYGFQVCEIVKRNESLRSTRVVLVGTIHHADRYRRPPVELYGADVYLEKPDVPDALLACLRQFGLPVPGGAVAQSAPSAAAPPPAPQTAAPSLEAPAAAPVAAPIAAPVAAPIAAPVAAPSAPPVAAPVSAPAAPPAAPQAVAPVAPSPTTEAPAPAAGDPALDEQRATAERLARIIVSDIILYNPDKFEEALRAGTVAEAMDADLEEGRALFRQRIDARVREEKDHLREELLRVAREKGMA